MVVVPAATPVTTPADETVALAVLLLLHEPPDTVSLKVIVAVSHTADEPEMEPASGDRSTEMFIVAVAEPQPLVTV
jgi:hypothetical protein